MVFDALFQEVFIILEIYGPEMVVQYAQLNNQIDAQSHCEGVVSKDVKYREVSENELGISQSTQV